MSQPLRSATRTETPATPALHALPAPHCPPPDELTPELSELICLVVEKEGISDASAGALAGVCRATLEAWKAEHADFAAALETARAQFELELVREIRRARKANGSLDWRAQAWLLLHLSADGIAKPGRAAKAPPAKPERAAAPNRAILPETPAAPPAPPVTAARENSANLPETPARPGASLRPGHAGAAGVQNTTILPETPNARAAAAVA